MLRKVEAAILLLMWITASYQIEAARITNYDLLEARDSEELAPIETGNTLLNYPSIGIIESADSRGNYSRRDLPNSGKDAATSTTQRPLIRVWNSILRSVQPNFRIFNITNPLTNIFTNGNANIIETVPMNAIMTNEAAEEPTSTSMEPSIKKKRTQQKRRPTFEYPAVSSMDYYGVTLPLAVDGHQPLFYYGPNAGSFINMRRIHTKIYNNKFYDDKTSDAEFIPVANLRELSSPQLMLRPVKFALKVPIAESAIVGEIKNDGSVANAVISGAANVDVDSANKADERKTKEHVGGIASNEVAPFSESMRNALGSYMSDDRQNRQRQRHSERQSDPIALAKTKPRQNKQFYLLQL